MEPESFDGFLGCLVRRPLLKNTIKEVWEMHKRYGLPINKLYLKGRSRVGCKLCVLSSKQDIRLTAKHRPEVIEEYAKWEKLVNEVSNSPASFFQHNKIPTRFHNGTAIVKRDTERLKAGQVVTTADIYAAVEWSKTLHGGKQVGFDFMYEEDDMHLPCQSGYCE